MPNTIIVNENDEIIGSASREEVDAQHAFYRVSALRITNSKGEILLAQRVLSKKHNPGKRSTSVAGTNEEGDSYLSNLTQEAKEEIGIDIDENMIAIGPKVKNTGEHNYFCQRYFLTIDQKIEEFTIQKEEVMNIRRISKEDLLNELTYSPQNFTKNLPKVAKDIGLI